MRVDLNPTGEQKRKLVVGKMRIAIARDAVREMQEERSAGSYLKILDVRGPDPRVRVREAVAIHKGVFPTSVVHGHLTAGLKEGRDKPVDESTVSRIYSPRIKREGSQDYLQITNIGWVALAENLPDNLTLLAADLQFPEDGEEWAVIFREDTRPTVINLHEHVMEDSVEEQEESAEEFPQPPSPIAVSTLTYLASEMLSETTLSPDQEVSLDLVLEAFGSN